MRVQDIQFLIEYNYWARDRILENVAKLSPEQFVQPSSYSHGGIRDTLVHILSAEWVWRVRCQESLSPKHLLSTDDFPSLETLQTRWSREEEQMRGYLAGLSDRELEQVIQYKRTGGERKENVLWHLLAHIVNHGTEHRSVLALELTGYGYSPGDLDIVHFVRDHGETVAGP
jgi:uncharacterized damage-inducible protein DinB